MADNLKYVCFQGQFWAIGTNFQNKIIKSKHDLSEYLQQEWSLISFLIILRYEIPQNLKPASKRGAKKYCQGHKLEGNIPWKKISQEENCIENQYSRINNHITSCEYEQEREK